MTAFVFVLILVLVVPGVAGAQGTLNGPIGGVGPIGTLGNNGSVTPTGPVGPTGGVGPTGVTSPAGTAGGPSGVTSTISGRAGGGTPAVLGGQGITGSAGAAAVSGGNTIKGSTLQGSASSLGNAANTAVQGLKGQNVNANLNTNQNTQGINIGSIAGTGGGAGGGEGYTGTVEFASPNQYIGFGSSTSVNFLQLPGFLGVPSNFSQPYKPDTWVNGPGPIVPSTLSMAQADECRSSGISDSWDGASRASTESIELIWPTLGQKFPTLSTPTSYLGTSKVSATEKYSFMATVCQAAYQAMKHGATRGIVSFVVRPKNKTAGIGFGGSAGASGVPSGVTAANPYSVAGLLGFGTGVARAYVEGELIMHITALRDTPKSEGPKGDASKPEALGNGNSPLGSVNTGVQPVADKTRDGSERTRPQADDNRPSSSSTYFGGTAVQGR